MTEDTRAGLENNKSKSQDKGKAKMTESTRKERAVDANSDSSFVSGSTNVTSTMSRITDSALAQGRNLFSNSAVASSGLSSGKAGPASGVIFQPASRDSANHTTNVTPSSQGSLRSTNLQDHIVREEAAFAQFLDATQVAEASGHEEANLLDGMASSSSSHVHPATQRSQRAHQSENDGLEVVRLLDDHSYAEVMAVASETALTVEEEFSLRQALFGSDADFAEGKRMSTDWTSLLNFVPEYISNGSSGWGYVELSQHLGTSDVVEASQIWADQWGDVLSCYTDQVWGDLGLLVMEAKKEARKVQESGREARPSEVQAIMRLRQILAQVRGN